MRNPFKRNQDNQTIADLENYYTSSYNSGSSNSGKAWLMALLSLIITLVVIVALFFGVRWIYRALTDDNASEAERNGQVQVDEGRQNGFNGNNGGDITIGDGSTDPRSEDDTTVGVINPDNTTDESSSNSNSSENDGEGVVSDEAASTSRDVAGSNSSLSTTGGNENLPNTGANELLFALPLVTLALSYYLSIRNKQTR